MSLEVDITEIRKIHELMGKVDKDAVAHHLWGKAYDDLSDEQKAMLDRPMEVTEADVPKKSLFKPATPEQVAGRPQPPKFDHVVADEEARRQSGPSLQSFAGGEVNDYVLRGRSAWIDVDNLTVYIHRN